MTRFVCLLMLLAFSAQAQRCDITAVELNGDKVNIYYNLIDNNPTNTYTISVYSSRDNFISPLAKVTGDLGLEVHPGINKKVTWDALDELGPTFDGKVSLEIRGRVYIPFIKLEPLQKHLKRGKPTRVTWSGGSSQAILNFELYRGDDKIEAYPAVPNVKEYEFTLSTSVKPGDGYYFRISDSKNKDDVVLSPSFGVGRKVPLAFKAAGLAVVGGAVVLLGGGGSKNNDIPSPLLPDGIN